MVGAEITCDMAISHVISGVSGGAINTAAVNQLKISVEEAHKIN